MEQELQTGSRLAWISGNQDGISRPCPRTAHPPSLFYFSDQRNVDEHSIPRFGDVTSDDRSTKRVQLRKKSPVYLFDIPDTHLSLQSE
jgi:hypothetical protein